MKIYFKYMAQVADESDIYGEDGYDYDMDMDGSNQGKKSTWIFVH